jgi:hypothetical protein
MASSVALASILTSGAVAVAVPLIAARLQRSQRRDDRRAEQFDELRSVVDSASIALAHAERTLRSLESAVEQECRDAAGDEVGATTDAMLNIVEDAVDEVAQAWHRVAARLGWTSETCRHYGSSLDQLKAELAMLVDVRAGGPSSDDLEGWGAVVRELHGVRARYADHRTGFYASTSRLVGPNAR